MVQPVIRRREERSPRLTAPQLALLRVLWERSEATVAEMQRALHAERPLAATTIATLLSRLEKRGIVAYRIEGRQYVYRAVLNERDARRARARRSDAGALRGRHRHDGEPVAVVS